MMGPPLRRFARIAGLRGRAAAATLSFTRTALVLLVRTVPVLLVRTVPVLLVRTVPVLLVRAVPVLLVLVAQDFSPAAANAGAVRVNPGSFAPARSVQDQGPTARP